MCQLIASALLPSIVLVVVVITSRFVAPRAILLVTPAWGGRAAQMILVFIVNPSCRDRPFIVLGDCSDGKIDFGWSGRRRATRVRGCAGSVRP
ncbi:hypothetical protein F5883DRAFT_127592 [Diaporthe sp. PMI_573]|nr:hypothetical protein F5883DRAFT_127592 [Diaporthaceae sp. PMI_573]